MDETQKPRDAGPPVAWRNLLMMAAVAPRKTFLLGSSLFAIYFGLFFLTGLTISVLVGTPLWPTVGLVLLLRMCLT